MRCGCGESLVWAECPFVGLAYHEPELFELRNCPSCGTTISSVITPENAPGALKSHNVLTVVCRVRR